jgi:nucleoside-diphosphate-sugar epimerase
MEAELALRAIAAETGMEVVIIRPPLVYGPGVKANFATMARWVRKGIPLPLGAIHNRRSLVGLDNLVDLIVTCICRPQAANQTFMASDGHDLSTTDLLRGLALAMGRPARLVPVPQPLVESALRWVGRGDWVARLCGNLQVDISHTSRVLGWTPPLTVEEGLRRAVTHNTSL